MAAASPSSSPSPPPKSQPPPPILPAQQANPKPICTWTHHETINLIQAYQEKWYSLKRGQLKSSQWEEIAVTIAVKCGYDYSHPSAKSAIQCRHKMEKLRRRYRTEKQTGANAGGRWPYYLFMECLENGSAPIPAMPMSQLRPSEDDEEEDESYSKSRSINYILRKPTYVNRFSSTVSLKRHRNNNNNYAAEEVGPISYEEERREEEGMGTEMVAAEVRRFAERMVKIEKQKMEMMKETERWRIEMENRRVRKILDSQRKIVDMIHMVFRNDDDDDDDDDDQVIKVDED